MIRSRKYLKCSPARNLNNNSFIFLAGIRIARFFGTSALLCNSRDHLENTETVTVFCTISGKHDKSMRGRVSYSLYYIIVQELCVKYTQPLEPKY